jgi:queuine tRNA-ribosyltransferase
MFEFDYLKEAKGSRARAGVFHTEHGAIETPVFMPVGTQASVKTLSPHEVSDTGADIILANTYHLHLRPGSEIVKQAGGLHKFENWNGALLTDSGGFQVFSLKDISKITDDGVEFQSHLDGSRHFFSPEKVMEIEHNLGADIIMAFDECPASDAEPKVIEAAVRRTLDWAQRCNDEHHKQPFHFGFKQALFGIVQGGTIEELRTYCARELVAMDFPGYAIGGLAVGESTEQLYRIAEFTAKVLPENKPRYLMGVGKPENILEAIDRGVDMFDCVMPTRNARNGMVYTMFGRLNMQNAKFKTDFDNPIEPGCTCYACQNFSRAYISHLYRSGELFGLRLLSIHNVHFYVNLVKEARRQILADSFKEWKAAILPKIMGRV